MVKMASMGLHVFNPAWNKVQDSTTIGKKFSGSVRDVTFKLFGTDETLTLPLQVCTKVGDVKAAFAQQLMVNDANSIVFVAKQGPNFRKQLDMEEIASKVTVKGIESFKPVPRKWPYPTLIIGAGYNGLKCCMHHIKAGDTNIVCYDRFDRFGGYCWLMDANKTSKLQTEFGSFHVWWGPDFLEYGKCGGYPSVSKGWEIWPKQKELLEHFEYAADEYGVRPYVTWKSNVAAIDIIGDKNDINRYYNITVNHTDKDETSETRVSVIWSFPGSMQKNRQIEYPGEETFGGHVGFGMGDQIGYDCLEKKNIAILGNGAFAIENVRTCCEYGCNKVYVVTRRKNLPSPRVPCWFVHQGPAPTPGKLVLQMFQPMYDLCGFGDPWEYWSVHADKNRTRATIIQGSRFGIGDVTFLAVAYGKAEYVQDTLKRLTFRTLHLTSGRKLEEIDNLCKALGVTGDFSFDRMQKMKEIVGNWCSGDYRRPVMVDPLGMNAANFTTFSTGIGSHGFIHSNKYIIDYPKEYNLLVAGGILQALPRQKADEKLDKPAYVTDVKHAVTAGFIVGGLCPRADQQGGDVAAYKHKMYHMAHGTDVFLSECKKSWDMYQETWKQQGSTHDYIPYPYTREVVEGFFKDYSEALGFPLSPDGPPAEEARPASSEIPVNDDTIRYFGTIVETDHKQWWASSSQSNTQLSMNMKMASTNQQLVTA